MILTLVDGEVQEFDGGFDFEYLGFAQRGLATHLRQFLLCPLKTEHWTCVNQKLG